MIGVARGLCPRLTALAAALAAAAWLASAPAYARVIHHVEGSFTGEGLPGGLGPDLLGVAVADMPAPGGGVWVQEATLNGQGADAVYKLTPQGRLRA